VLRCAVRSSTREVVQREREACEIRSPEAQTGVQGELLNWKAVTIACEGQQVAEKGAAAWNGIGRISGLRARFCDRMAYFSGLLIHRKGYHYGSRANSRCKTRRVLDAS
jgi:hypothetical protein